MTAAPSHYDPLEAVVAALREHGCHVQAAGRDRYEAQCPAHDDRDPSLSVGRGSKGEPKAVVYCHAGCGTADILEALDLEPAALFADYDPDRARTVTYLHHIRAWKDATGAAPKPKLKPWRREKTDHYDYVWSDGTPAARVVRYNKVDVETGEIVGKTFTQHRYDNQTGTYAQSLDGLDVPPYHADAVASTVKTGLPIIVCEGEKDADNVTAAWGITATCNPMGADAWRPHHTKALTGGNVIIVADDDEAGHRHAQHIHDELQTVAEQVVMWLPAEGCKDLTDHINAGYGINDLRGLEQPDDPYAQIRADLPCIDWHALWADDSEEEWIVEPILPARRLVALYSAPKVGKSLLMLEIAVGVSNGSLVLGHQVTRPYRVLYVDFENDPKGDIRTRLQAMGHGPDNLDNLHYLSFPTMQALDSKLGGEQLLAAIAAYQCEVVVIDTVSRAVKGDENENDTWLAFYRHTGLLLKQAQVALIRLDHSGKDETKGQRGGSAKSGDVDAVWRMSSISDTVFTLTCEASRLAISEKTITLHRETIPRLHHRVDAAGAAAAFNARVEELVAWLDANEVNDNATNSTTRQAMRERGYKVGKPVSEEAVRRRQARPTAWTKEP